MAISRRKLKALRKANKEAKDSLTELFKDLDLPKYLRELFHFLVIQSDLNGLIKTSASLKSKLIDRFKVESSVITSRIKELIDKGFFVRNSTTSLRLNANQEMFDASKVISLVKNR